MNDIPTTARLLALNLAATTTRDEVRRLVQDHLDVFDGDERTEVLALALATLAGDVLLPAVELMAARDQWRQLHRNAVTSIVAAPNEKEN